MNIQQRLDAAKRQHKLFGKRKSFRNWLRSPSGREWRYQAPSTSLDFRGDEGRPWQPWRMGLPFNVGSGRAADWLHVGYLRYALTCRLLHERLGWSGQRVRDVAKTLCRHAHEGHDWKPPAESLPEEVAAALPRLRGEAEHDEAGEHRYRWIRWNTAVVKPAWGAFMLDYHRALLLADLSRHAPSMIVGEIRRLRGATDATDFRGCSGCEHLPLLVDLSTEEQEWWLSRARECERTRVAGLIDAVVVPFGLPFPGEFDHCLVMGLSGEVRVRQADFDALTPTQRSQVMR